MEKIIRKGTIFEVYSGIYKTLEDSGPHGCPFVIKLDKYNNEIKHTRRAMTLYLRDGDTAFRIIHEGKKEVKVNRFELMDMDI